MFATCSTTSVPSCKRHFSVFHFSILAFMLSLFFVSFTFSSFSLRKSFLVFFQYCLFEFLTKVLVNRVRHFSIGAIYGLPTRHTYNKMTIRTLNNFHTPYDKAIVKGNIYKRLEFFFIPKPNGNFGDLHGAIF